MPLPGSFTAATDPERLGKGLVYCDASLRASPATHALIIGVGAYRSAELGRPLTTATLSAREIADWFVDETKARFDNDGQKLGSLAVVLSETTAKSGQAQAVYAGGPVPRASYEETAAAVSGWLDRVNTHKDNLAFLYIAGHGASHLGRTGFLLEDFGTRPHMVTYGMSEVEQFISALECAKPVRQLLLFDCCRAPTGVRLPWDTPLGFPLIALQRDADDHGEPRKQWAICSTSLGEYAIGLANGPTLFNTALIEALNGVAADTSTNGWPVRPGVLVDKIDRILALHRLQDEKAQTPAGRMAGSFDITFAGESEDVPVYITLDDPAEWADTTIALTIDGAASPPILGEEGQSPFHLRRLPEAATLEAVAARGTSTLGRLKKTKVRPPAMFLTISKASAAPTDPPSVRTLDFALGGAQSELVLRVASPMSFDSGAVADIAGRGRDAPNARSVTVALNGSTIIPLPASDYTVTLRLPDGRSLMSDVTLVDGQRREIDFALQSPHEWMASAAVSGGIREAPPSLSGLEGLEPEHVITVHVVGGLDADLEARSVLDPQLLIVQTQDDGRFVRFDVDDRTPSRFVQNMSPMVPPVFARVASSSGRTEMAIIPSLGNAGAMSIGGWSPSLLVDRRAPDQESMTTVVVEDRRWAALLGFVASRDFAAGETLLDAATVNEAINALGDKVSNPIAAAAGALIAVANSNPDIEKTWDPWLGNLAEWFRDMPDGPIILGRRRLMGARSAEEIARAREAFVEGFHRGVPFYSLSVSWLARGLESLPGKDADLVAMRATARALANRVDPTRAFTVIRLEG